MKHLIILLFASILSFSAHADISSASKGFLLGMGSLIVIDHIHRDRLEKMHEEEHHVHVHHHYDPVQEAYERGLRDREREHMRNLRDYAYQCGRYGRFCDRL